MTADHAYVGARLRAERKRNGWDVPEMARRLRSAAGDRRGELPPRDTLMEYIRKRWEPGKHALSERYAILYTRAFDLTEDELFGPARQASATTSVHDNQSASDLIAGLLSPGAETVLPGSVEVLTARVHALRLADDVVAGGDLLVPAFRELDSAVAA